MSIETSSITLMCLSFSYLSRAALDILSSEILSATAFIGRKACIENTITIIINGKAVATLIPLYAPTPTTRAVPSPVIHIRKTTYGIADFSNPRLTSLDLLNEFSVLEKCSPSRWKALITVIPLTYSMIASTVSLLVSLCFIPCATVAL